MYRITTNSRYRTAEADFQTFTPDFTFHVVVDAGRGVVTIASSSTWLAQLSQNQFPRLSENASWESLHPYLVLGWTIWAVVDVSATCCHGLRVTQVKPLLVLVPPPCYATKD